MCYESNEINKKPNLFLFWAHSIMRVTAFMYIIPMHFSVYDIMLKIFQSENHNLILREKEFLKIK